MQHKAFKGKVLLEYSKNFNLDKQSEDEITDHDGHGTLCAGIAAGCPFNDAYMTNPDDTPRQYTYSQQCFPGGIAPKAKLIVCRIDFSEDQVLKALEHLISIQGDNGIKVDVICMSFGLGKHHDDIEDKLRTLRRCGTVCIASAGNDGKTRPNAVTFPATCGDVICVGANDSHGCLANFSPVGQEIKCLAPGVNIAGPVTHTKDCLDKVFTKHPSRRLTAQCECPTANNEALQCASGTSYAAPAVAGLICLLIQLARKPNCGQKTLDMPVIQKMLKEMTLHENKTEGCCAPLYPLKFLKRLKSNPSEVIKLLD